MAMKKGASATNLIIMTIGHSTRPVQEFIRLLKAHQVRRLVDVRTNYGRITSTNGSMRQMQFALKYVF